jgi:hypothetical protein
LRISAPQERTVNGVRILQLRRDFIWPDGTSDVLIESRLIGPQASYSLVSASPKFDWTRNNFEGFLAPMVDVACLAHQGSPTGGNHQSDQVTIRVVKP